MTLLTDNFPATVVSGIGLTKSYKLSTPVQTVKDAEMELKVLRRRKSIIQVIVLIKLYFYNKQLFYRTICAFG